MGVSPPAIRVALNGLPWEVDQNQEIEYISDRDDDSLAVVLQVFDESQVSLPAIFDLEGQVPDSLLEVIAESAGGRRMEVGYRTRLERQDYSLLFRVFDYDGGHREVRLRVPLTVAFYEQTADDLLPLSMGSVLAPDAALVVTLRTGVHLTAEDVSVLANQQPLELAAADLEQPPDDLFSWTLRFAGLDALDEGPVRLEVRVEQRDLSSVTVGLLDVEIGSVELHFRRCHWIPNPFGEQSTLVYELSRDAARVDLRLYNASGRRILAREDLPAKKGLRHFVWRGQDDDGDEVANGLYFYELVARGADAQRADRLLDKILRAQ
jgi:hypothetical protein